MATNEQYQQAFSNVASGNASKRDRELTEKAAKQAGSFGNQAREAQRRGAQRSR